MEHNHFLPMNGRPLPNKTSKGPGLMTNLPDSASETSLLEVDTSEALLVFEVSAESKDSYLSLKGGMAVPRPSKSIIIRTHEERLSWF